MVLQPDIILPDKARCHLFIGGVLAKFDAEYLDEEKDFTFEDFEMPETFAVLAGMM